MIDNTQDILDTRDLLARIEELKSDWEETVNAYPDYDAIEVVADDYVLSEDDWSVGLGEDGAHEIVTLIELIEEVESYAGERPEHGVTLIADSYFEEYAQQLAEDLGIIDTEASWPLYCIDWERAANDLRMDYSEVNFDGAAYWVRS